MADVLYAALVEAGVEPGKARTIAAGVAPSVKEASRLRAEIMQGFAEQRRRLMRIRRGLILCLGLLGGSFIVQLWELAIRLGVFQ